MTTSIEDTRFKGTRAPDFILKAVERPQEGEKFSKAIRVGAAWINQETKTISISLDNYIVLRGKPHSNTHLILVPREESNGNENP